jgi:hypothetical protein
MLKSFRFVGAAAVLLLLGITGQVNARQDQKDNSKGQDKQQQQGKPADRQQQPQARGQQNQQHQQPQPQAKAQERQPQQQPQAKAQQGKQPQQQPQAKAQQSQQRQQQSPQQDNSAKPQQQARGQQNQQQGNSAKPQQQAKGQQDQQRQQPRPQDNSANRQQQAQGQQNQQRQQVQPQNNRSAQQHSPAQAHQEQVAWQGSRANNWKSDHRTWQQRGGYSGYRVPDASFRADYGASHGFRIYNLPVMFVGGQQRFQYGGFWFGLVDPWPEYWSSSWYDDDDVYVDYYGDGYYLYNRRYPGDRIAISFYLN